MKRLVLSLLLAALLWTIMFSPWTAPQVNFWWMMSGSATLLALCASLAHPAWWQGVRFRLSDVAGGIVVAAALWMIFWTGDKLSAWLFDFARPQVDAIYGMKEGESPWLLSLLMRLLGTMRGFYFSRSLTDSVLYRVSPNVMPAACSIS